MAELAFGLGHCWFFIHLLINIRCLLMNSILSTALFVWAQVRGWWAKHI